MHNLQLVQIHTAHAAGQRRSDIVQQHGLRLAVQAVNQVDDNLDAFSCHLFELGRYLFLRIQPA